MGTMPKPELNGPQYPIESVDRALRLLLMFRQADRIRIADAAAELGVANSTAHRLLAMLLHYGFVAKNDDDRSYAAGGAFLELGLAALQRFDMLSAVQAALVSASERLGETANLVVLRGADAVFVGGVESKQVVRVADQTGLHLPAGNGAAGRVLLAALPPEQVRKLYPDGFVPATDRFPEIPLDELEQRLAVIRPRGYEIAQGPDYVAVAVPLVVAGRTMTSLAVAAPPHRGTQQWQREARTTLLDLAQDLEVPLT
jgi:IclR family transcriptional regulator, acetate operon repressor